MTFWQHFFWLIVLSVGNAEILVTIVNRVHAFPVHERYLREFRHLHDLLIPLFPSWLVVVIGFFGPGVFVEPITPAETWQSLPWMVQAYFVVCVFGFAGFLFSMGRYLTYRVPQQQVQLSSEITNVEKELGYRPTGSGPFLSLTKLRGNQCFEVEWTERTFELPHIPKAWDGLTILHLTDLHFIGTMALPFFEFVCEKAQTLKPDMICFTGDLLDGNEFVEWIPQTLGKLEAPHGKYFILGNHDWYLDVPPIRATLTELGWRDVSGQTLGVDIHNHKLSIGGTEKPWIGAHPHFTDERDESFRLLLSHTPDNFAWACRNNVDLVLAGHNHGGQVVFPVIGPIYSPSLHGCRNASGVYSKDQTLMFVSRGVSGRHPLRIRCRPEVSLIRLKSQDDSG
jgi:predicted MPP superfamily phosphohydrolase